jgi:uncharacterized membrane protein YeaQ/YmgE (transglycosylase-associated protein family)
MNTFLWIVVCLFAGWLTCRVLRDRGLGVRFGSWFGIAGAVVAGGLAYLLNVTNAVKGINLTSILVAFLGAVLTVFILRAIVPSVRWVNTSASFE